MNSNIQLRLNFTDTVDEEVSQLVRDLRLVPLVAAIKDNEDSLAPELTDNLSYLIEFVADLFSTSLPELYDNPEKTLRTISRDINLSRLLRERGLFRLYRLITQEVLMDMMSGEQTDEENEFTAELPIFMAMENPNTNNRFATQEEFIGWFCDTASVSRGLVFSRIGTITKLKSLGFDLDNAFNIITKKPSVIFKMFKKIGMWEDNELIGLDENTALKLAEHRAPDMIDNVKDLIESGDDDIPEQLANMLKPVIADLTEEVAYHENSKGALDFVSYDILGEPEITYKWSVELDALIIEFVHKIIDEDGEEHIIAANEIVLMPDTDDLLPHQVKKDLIKRLPIKNRSTLDIT